MVVSLEKFEKSLLEIQEMLDKLPKHMRLLEKQVELCELESQDIMHKIELSNFNAHEGWKLAKDLQITRRARRKAKDDLKGLEILHNRIKRKSPLLQHTAAAARVSERHEKHLEERKYYPRVRKDFSGEGWIERSVRNEE